MTSRDPGTCTGLQACWSPTAWRQHGGGTPVFVLGQWSLAGLGDGGVGVNTGMKKSEGARQPAHPHLCQRLVLSTAGEFSAKQKPSLQFTVTAKHKAQLANTQTTKYVKVSILEPKGTATFSPLDVDYSWLLPSLEASTDSKFNLDPKLEDRNVL